MEKKKEKNIFSLKRLFNKDSDEIKKLKKIKKKIKEIKTIEDLDALEEELIEIGVIEEEELEKIKKLKKKKKRKSEKEIFEERVRCNLEIINRTIIVGKQFKEKQRIRQDKEMIQNKDERDSRSGVKEREERMR